MKPILFNTPMVQALLSGQKKKTRRVIKVPPKARLIATGDSFLYFEWYEKARNADIMFQKVKYIEYPYCPGDILWVREAWCSMPVTPGGHLRGHNVYYYRADPETRPKGWQGNWRPSIHMPRKAARIFLRVTDVRVERLQDIDDDGVIAEGLEIGAPFEEIWDSTIRRADRGRYGWDANPWVWVISFERCTEDGERYGSD